MDEVEAGREREEMCVICLYSLERLAVVEERMRDDATQLARGEGRRGDLRRGWNSTQALTHARKGSQRNKLRKPNTGTRKWDCRLGR